MLLAGARRDSGDRSGGFKGAVTLLMLSAVVAPQAYGQCLRRIFDVPEQISLGATPSGVAITDLNGDGVDDLVVLSADSDQLFVLLSDGAGSLGPPAAVPVGTLPSAVTPADVNGDGKMDLLVTNAGSNSLSVLLGDGTGRFSAGQPIEIAGAPSSVAMSDFDGDGALDLAVTASRGDAVHILLGDGAGAFTAHKTFAVGVNPRKVVLGEFSAPEVEDRPHVDLAVTNADSNNVSVLRGEGGGNFLDALNFPVGVTPLALVAGDFNGDRQLDLLTANQGSDNVSLLLASPIGGFRSELFEAWLGPSGLAAADLDRDGSLDLVVPNPEVKTVSLLFGDGRGAFAKPLQIALAVSPTDVALGDLTGDGKADLVAASPRGGVVVLLRNVCLPPLSWWALWGVSLLTLGAILVLPWLWRRPSGRAVH